MVTLFQVLMYNLEISVFQELTVHAWSSAGLDLGLGGEAERPGAVL